MQHFGAFHFAARHFEADHFRAGEAVVEPVEPVRIPQFPVTLGGPGGETPTWKKPPRRKPYKNEWEYPGTETSVWPDFEPIQIKSSFLIEIVEVEVVPAQVVAELALRCSIDSTYKDVQNVAAWPARHSFLELGFRTEVRKNLVSIVETRLQASARLDITSGVDALEPLSHDLPAWHMSLVPEYKCSASSVEGISLNVDRGAKFTIIDLSIDEDD